MSNRYLIPDLKVFLKNDSDIVMQENFISDTYFFQNELTIKNSRFICTLAHCDTIESARCAIDYIQRYYSDATHNCYAFQVDAPKSTAHIGYSDDNEPHGTAGKPMLTQLLYSEVGETAAVVTRYYGGIKLGTGGLVRAYQESVAKALELLPLKTRVEEECIKIILDYSHAGFLHRMLEAFEVKIIHEDFSADITYSLSIPTDRKVDFLAELQQVTDGTFILE